MTSNNQHSIFLAPPSSFSEIGLRCRLTGLEIRDSIFIPYSDQVILAILVRVPFECTILEHELRYGTSCLGINSARIALNSYDINEYIPNRVGYKDGINHVQKAHDGYRRKNVYSIPNTGQVFDLKGRFPTNLILSHTPTCECVSTGTEEIPDWNCQPDCPVRLLDLQSGELHSQDPITRMNGQKSPKKGVTDFQTGSYAIAYDDEGGASRFFKQVRNESELKSYLETLIRGGQVKRFSKGND